MAQKMIAVTENSEQGQLRGLVKSEQIITKSTCVAAV